MDEVKREFYSPNSMCRYNPLWAIILGERSVGKSFAFKERSINTPNSIWIYLRRTDVDRKDPKNWKSYLSELIVANKIDIDDEYKVNSEGIWVNGEQKVIFSALSTDSSAHSMSYLPDSLATNPKPSKTKKKLDKLTDDYEGNYDGVIDEIITAEASFDTRKPLKK